jgi:hypothetical protein
MFAPQPRRRAPQTPCLRAERRYAADAARSSSPFGLEGIDFEVMHSELLGFTELVNRLGTMSQVEVAGQVSAEREQRASGGTPCPPEN